MYNLLVQLVCISYATALITVNGKQCALMLCNSKLIPFINLHNQTESFTNIVIAKMQFSL